MVLRCNVEGNLRKEIIGQGVGLPPSSSYLKAEQEEPLSPTVPGQLGPQQDHLRKTDGKRGCKSNF